MTGKGSCPNLVDPTLTTVSTSDPLRTALRSITAPLVGPPRERETPGAAAPGLVLCDVVWCYVQCQARAPGPVKAKYVYTDVGLTPARLTGASEADNPAGRSWP